MGRAGEAVTPDEQRADAYLGYLVAIGHYRAAFEALRDEIGEDQAREIVRRRVERDRG